MARPGSTNSLSDIGGLSVGCAEDAAALTGVTVIVPEARAVCGVVPMARFLPEDAIEHLRRAHLDIARGVETAAHVGFDGAPERQAFLVPEHHAAPLFLHVE